MHAWMDGLLVFETLSSLINPCIPVAVFIISDKTAGLLINCTLTEPYMCVRAYAYVCVSVCVCLSHSSVYTPCLLMVVGVDGLVLAVLPWTAKLEPLHCTRLTSTDNCRFCPVDN